MCSSTQQARPFVKWICGILESSSLGMTEVSWRFTCCGFFFWHYLLFSPSSREEDLMETSWPPSLSCSLVSLRYTLVNAAQAFTHTHTQRASEPTFLLRHQHWISRSQVHRKEIRFLVVCMSRKDKVLFLCESVCELHYVLLLTTTVYVQ